jgi:hypothetical protein
VKVPVNMTNVVDDSLIEGIWFGMFSSTNQKRRRGKQAYELGRTLSFSLIVKNVFEQTDELGVLALDKDNFFFGNNDGEVSNGMKVPFFIKTKLRSFFDDPRLGDLVYGIINNTASSVGFKFLTEEEQDKVISDHLLPVDKLITSCYPVTISKRGRQEIRKTRKPNPIRSSPLYTKDEIAMISLLTSYIFKEFEVLSKDYEFQVLSTGFAAIESQIRETIRLRWETLQRFANRTKLRLQAIRPMVNNPTLKKASVAPNHVDQLLESYHNPATHLVSDIKHILGGASLRDAISSAYKKNFDSEQDASRFLYIEVLDMYKRTCPKHPHIASLTSVPLVRNPTEMDFVKSTEDFIKLQSTMGNLKKQSLGFTKIQSFKLFGRTKQIEGLLKMAEGLLTSLKTIPEESADIALRLSSDGLYKSRATYVTHISSKLLKEVGYLSNASKLRLLEEDSKEVKNLLESFLKTLSSISLN